ncbi:MAG: hypothetical protein RLZZ383_904, partial [Pseudomonadota bacterium]
EACMRRAGWQVVSALALGACQRNLVVLESRVVDVFEQVDTIDNADVLFVVDDSKSMREEQSLLTDAVVGLVDALTATDVDYRFGVVSTDAAAVDAGVLRGGVLDPWAVDIVRSTKAALIVGTDGDRVERGFDVAELALNGSTNPGFPRADARLDVVFVSDEDDQSSGDVGGHVEALRAVAGTWGFAVHGIVGDLPAGCSSPSGAADVGSRYHEAIATTGGLTESICATSYRELLSAVGVSAAGLLETFPLTRLPDPTTLEVRVDGVVMPQRSRDGWRYEPASNAIRFTGFAVPRPLMKIEVAYGKLSDRDRDTPQDTETGDSDAGDSDTSDSAAP